MNGQIWSPPLGLDSDLTMPSWFDKPAQLPAHPATPETLCNHDSPPFIPSETHQILRPPIGKLLMTNGTHLKLLCPPGADFCLIIEPLLPPCQSCGHTPLSNISLPHQSSTSLNRFTPCPSAQDPALAHNMAEDEFPVRSTRSSKAISTQTVSIFQMTLFSSVRYIHDPICSMSSSSA